MTLEVAPSDDLATCHALRRIVFIKEQSVPEAEELDGRDAGALHLLARLDEVPVGCARILIDGETGKIGRVCVLAEYRGQGIGAALIQAALDLLRDQPGVTRAKLGAQLHALEFYERLGFVAEGPDYLDAGIAHRYMVRRL
ncbi:MAG: GNAT family N-acetyltransferase [Rhodobacteraceae bacterium]|nr:GNAT family N-acetyltransferase [Paracoccaceae bacterium]